MKKYQNNLQMLSVAIFAGVFIVGSVSSVYAQRGGDKYEYKLEDTLTELKRSAKNVVEKNLQIQDKIKGLEARVPQLKKNYKKTQSLKDNLAQDREEIKEELKSISGETQIIRKRLENLELDITQVNKSYSRHDKKIVQKQKKKLILQSEAEGIRDEIAALKGELKKEERKYQNSAFMQERNQLVDSISAITKDIDVALKEHEQIQHVIFDLKGELGDLSNDNMYLGDELSYLEGEFQDVLKDEKQIYTEMIDFENKEKNKRDLVNTDIENLKDYRDELIVVLNKGRNTNSLLKSQFQSEKNLYISSIDRLEKENKLLVDKVVLLNQDFDASQELVNHMERTRSSQDRVMGYEKKISGLLNNQENQKGSVVGNHQMKVQLKAQHEALTKEIKKLQKRVETAKGNLEDYALLEMKRINKLIGQERKNLKQRIEKLSSAKKEVSEPVNELKVQEMKKEGLMETIKVIQMEIREVDKQKIQLEKGIVTSKKKGKVNEIQLTREIAKLKAYQQELIELLEVVNERFDSSLSDAKVYLEESDELNEHVALLEEENIYLKEELLSLEVLVEKLKNKLE